MSPTENRMAGRSKVGCTGPIDVAAAARACRRERIHIPLGDTTASGQFPLYEAAIVRAAEDWSALDSDQLAQLTLFESAQSSHIAALSVQMMESLFEA